ncbi:MAG: T9SS type A sorting domain-containing protein [Bacteroidia bacterium]|nr:T9SS type A sorting domain-containing protein [Bacteroidia bacterium]
MKKALLSTFSLLSLNIVMAQQINPIQVEFTDPFQTNIFSASAAVSDEFGNTFLSTKIGNTSSGIMKVNGQGDIIWQKKINNVLTGNQATQIVFDGENIVYQPNDGVYVATCETDPNGMGTNPIRYRYLSKCNPTTGTFNWHIALFDTLDYTQSNKNILLNSPTGLYWIFANKFVSISTNGTILAQKSLSIENIVSAQVLPDGSCYLTNSTYSGETPIVKIDANGNVLKTFSFLNTGMNIFANANAYKLAYHNGNIYVSFWGQGVSMIKLDTTGQVLNAVKWEYPAPWPSWFTARAGNWIIYNNQIVFSHGALVGPIENFVRLNPFSVLDLNLNEVETFCLPHYSTFHGNNYSTMNAPNTPEVMNINDGFLQITGSKGENNLLSGNFLRIDSSLTFKNCQKIMIDSIPNYTTYTITTSLDTVTATTIALTPNNVFLSNSNLNYTDERDDLSITSISSSTVYCGECTSTALALTSGETAVVYYNWGTESGNQTNNPANNLCPGNYSLVISDNYGCQDSSAFEIIASAPIASGLCLTTVDSLSTHNILVWEKPVSTVIAGFNIYREITANNFQFLAYVDYDSLSEYHDMNANPNITNYRYKLTTVDTCGSESSLSDYHSTIHLQLLGNGNMQWTLYDVENQGNPVSFYNVYRDDAGNGNWALLTGSLPGTNSTYTDINYSSFPNAKYRVDVNWGVSCTSSRTTINTTRSNIKAAGLVSIGISEVELNNLVSIAPNPASENVVINLPNSNENTIIQIYNTLGEIVISKTTSATSESLSVEQLAKGIYSIAITTEYGKVFKKLVVQ